MGNVPLASSPQEFWARFPLDLVVVTLVARRHRLHWNAGDADALLFQFFIKEAERHHLPAGGSWFDETQERGRGGHAARCLFGFGIFINGTRALPQTSLVALFFVGSIFYAHHFRFGGSRYHAFVGKGVGCSLKIIEDPAAEGSFFLLQETRRA